jgi:hypothetical protein
MRLLKRRTPSCIFSRLLWYKTASPDFTTLTSPSIQLLDALTCGGEAATLLPLRAVILLLIELVRVHSAVGLLASEVIFEVLRVGTLVSALCS